MLRRLTRRGQRSRPQRDMLCEPANVALKRLRRQLEKHQSSYHSQRHREHRRTPIYNGLRARSRAIRQCRVSA